MVVCWIVVMRVVMFGSWFKFFGKEVGRVKVGVLLVVFGGGSE